MSEKWHIFIPGVDFCSEQLFTEICETLIDEGSLIIVHQNENDHAFYKWRIKNARSKVIINGMPGQILKIMMEDQDKSKTEFVA